MIARDLSPRPCLRIEDIEASNAFEGEPMSIVEWGEELRGVAEERSTLQGKEHM